MAERYGLPGGTFSGQPRKQSSEVRDQADMLRVQADQLAEDRKVNAEQIRVLVLQAEELRQVAADRERGALERRRAQAELVYMWTGPESSDLKGHFAVQAYLRNTSQQPVYAVRFGWHLNGQFAGLILYSEPLMPGGTADLTLPAPPGTRPGPYDAVATFRDRGGTWWSIWPDGRLEELPERPPIVGLEQPADNAPPSEVASDVGE